MSAFDEACTKLKIDIHDLLEGVNVPITTALEWEHAIALRLLNQFCHSPGCGWLMYENGCWRHAGAEGALFRAVDALAQEFWAECFRFRDRVQKAFGEKLQSSRFIRGEIFTALEVMLARRDGDFDADPGLVNCEGLAVNLRTGERREARPGRGGGGKRPPAPRGIRRRRQRRGRSWKGRLWRERRRRRRRRRPPRRSGKRRPPWCPCPRRRNAPAGGSR